MKRIDPKEYWNSRMRKYGLLGTGYTEKLFYKYDDDLRWRAFRSCLKIQKHYRILDVGCNFGPWVFKLYNEGCRKITGIDISEEAVKIAKKKAIKLNTKARFVTATAEGFRFPREKFDIIYSITVMQHILDDKRYLKALGNYRRHLAEGGKVLLIESTPSKKKKQKLIYKRERTFKHQKDLFKKAGFKLIKTRGIDFIGYYVFYGIQLLPLPGTIKHILQKIGLAISKPLDILLSKVWLFTRFADLKLMVFEVKK